MNAPKTPFGLRLKEAGETYGRLCVGVDPHGALLQKWDLPVTIDGLKQFSDICVAAFADQVALVKPQVAFYEAFGAQGFVVLEDLIKAFRSAGTLVLADAKRSDIGSTMAGYGTAWLSDSSPLCSDAVTVSPFLGYESLRPVIDQAITAGRGVYVLAATSNPEARQLQELHDASGRSISQQIVDHCAAENAAVGVTPGSIGVVVGATLATPPVLTELDGPVLLPGVGAQGASLADVRRITQGVEDVSFANISRAILEAGPDVSALKNATTKALEAL
jgi:hypothetical protein